jgi:murein L,D-transpeptidase YcbB/YkuD
MRVVKSRIAWAVILLLAAGAGVNVSSRVFDPGGEPPLRLVLNIPSSRLDVYESGALTRSYTVSVGRRGFETPAGKYKVFRVVWNPWWHPPDSKWARNDKPTPPGPTNPMGRVKLQFANLLYIHGTTQESRLGAPASHGCVRMANEDLIQLTRLVHSYITPDLPESLLSQLERSPRQTRAFHLRQNVPLAVTYDLVEVHKGNLVIHPDVYRMNGKSIKEQLVAVLKKQGVDVAAIDPQRLDQLARTRRATRLTVALDTLMNQKVGGATGR